MKIVHVCICGGWYENNSYQDQLLPRYHRKAGHEVTIIASYYERWNLDKKCYEIDKTPVKILNDGTKLIRIKPVLPLVLNIHVHLFWGLKRAVEKESPDLIFVHGVESINYISMATYLRNHPTVKMLCDNHTDEFNSVKHWTTKLWSKYVVRNIIVKRLIPVTEYFYGTTPLRSDFMIEHYNIPQHKIKLLFMGADDEHLHFDKRSSIRSSIRDLYGFSNDDFLIVTGGRISYNKGIEILKFAEAVKEVEDNGIKLLIFGSISNECKKEFDRVCSSKVRLAGLLPSEKIYDYFLASDLVVFPGLHSVLWEQAVASKTPCFFNHIKGFEHIDIGGNCILMDVHDVSYYKDIITQLRNDIEYYKHMKNVALSNKSEIFLYSHIAQSVIDDVS